jgi:general secretion pathway protein M
MIGELRQWFAERSRREQLMLMILAAFALPILAWLLIIRPISSAYDTALTEHLEAIDRHGRVLALAEGPAPSSRPRAGGGDLQLLVTESAAAAGLALQRAEPSGPDAIDISMAGGRAPGYAQWLQSLEGQGLRIGQVSMAPAPDGSVTLTARILR